MKKFNSIIAVLLLCVSGASAQSSQSIPDKDFKLIFSRANMTLNKGESDSLMVCVLRSKAFKRGKANFNMSSPDKKGIIVNLVPVRAASDTCILKIAVSEMADPGAYFFVPNCTIQNKSKGTTFKVTVN